MKTFLIVIFAIQVIGLSYLLQKEKQAKLECINGINTCFVGYNECHQDMQKAKQVIIFLFNKLEEEKKRNEMHVYYL